MTSPSLLCRVQALYPFESDDPSSLRFMDGDYIDVLSKLPSGWWDGWCNGNRGWFPSNYVRTIEDYSSTGASSSNTSSCSAEQKQQRRISQITDLFDDQMEEGSARTNSLPPNWIIHSNQDGSASYYYNTVTGETRTTYPYDARYYENDSDQDSTTSTIDSNPKLEAHINSQNDGNVIVNDNDEALVQQLLDSKKKVWIQRTTPQGLPFFYNVSTEETAWHPDAQDPHAPPKSKPLKSLAVPEFDHHDPLSWNKLSLHISICINNLISAAKSAQTTVYKKYAATIVDAVRFMLTASGTISKESVFIKTNGVLRSHHRAMMASMSKIVLSAQLCADGTVTDVTKLVSDCHELLIAVRNFISTCENIHVQVSFVEPVLLSPLDEQSPEWEFAVRRHSSISTGSGSMIDPGIRAKYELECDLIDNLDTYGASMQESMESLMANLTRHSDSRSSLAVLLFTQYRNFGNQTGQFLSIIEDIDFQHVKHSSLMEELGTAKQKLYDGLGHLFFKMQTMTDDAVPLEQVIADMQVAAQSINDAIKLVCERMAALVHERSQMTQVECAKTEDSPQNTSNESIKDKSISEFLADSNNTLANPLPSHVLNMIPNQNASTPTIKVSNRSSAPNIDTLLYNHLNDDVEGEDDDDEGEYEDYYEDGDENNSQEGEEKSKRRRRLVLRKKRAQTLTLTQATHTSAKLKQFFGTDIPEPSSPSATPPIPTDSNHNVSDGHSFLEHDYSPGEIVFTMDGNVKGGTLRALVERMTLHDYLDMNFNTTFLLTYRSFCTSMDLVELLEKRYNIQPPEGLTIEDVELWTSKKQKLIRLRVFNVIKIWLEQYYYEEDSVILDRLLYFTSTSIKESSTFACYQLEKLIHRRKATCKDIKKIVANPHYGPDPILPRNLKKFRLLDLDTIEMARQLTVMDFKLYSSIKPIECLDKAWSRDTGVAANIKASIEYCNQVTTWVSDEILSQSEVKKRSTIIKYWVNVADKCRSFNNFNTCMAILSAFDNSAVGRLKRTWEMVGARTNHIVAHIRKLMRANKNFNQYRALIHSANPPCIPFLGIYLQDLTFVEDGNPNFLKTSKDLINFAKRAKTAEVIRELQQYQSMCYHFIAVDEVQAFITENLHSSRDEDQLYKESLKLEPKEREDEKITRLLQESGFL